MIKGLILYPLISLLIFFAVHSSMIFFIKNEDDKKSLQTVLTYVDSDYRYCRNVLIKELGDTIYVSVDKIIKGNAKCIIDKMSNKKTIFLENISGGIVVEAMLLGVYVQERAISVVSKGYCLSACSVILFSSNSAKLCFDSKVGVHQSTIYTSFFHQVVKERMKKAEKEIYSRKEKLLDYSFYYSLIKKTPSASIYLIKDDDLINHGLISEIISCG